MAAHFANLERLQLGFSQIFFALRHPVGGTLFHSHLIMIGTFRFFVWTSLIICWLTCSFSSYRFFVVINLKFCLCLCYCLVVRIRMCVCVSIVMVNFYLFIFSVYVVVCMYCSGAEEWHLLSTGVETINQSINQSLYLSRENPNDAICREF